MFHSSPARPFADMKNEGVAFEWRPFHQLQLVLADALEVLLDLFPLPVVTMNHNPNLGLDAGQLKFLEFACLNRTIGKLIVARGVTTEITDSAHRFHALDGRAGCLP